MPKCIKCKKEMGLFVLFERGRCSNCGIEADELAEIAWDLLDVLEDAIACLDAGEISDLATVLDFRGRAAIAKIHGS